MYKNAVRKKGIVVLTIIIIIIIFFSFKLIDNTRLYACARTYVGKNSSRYINDNLLIPRVSGARNRAKSSSRGDDEILEKCTSFRDQSNAFLFILTISITSRSRSTILNDRGLASVQTMFHRNK